MPHAARHSGSISCPPVATGSASAPRRNTRACACADGGRAGEASGRGKSWTGRSRADSRRLTQAPLDGSVDTACGAPGRFRTATEVTLAPFRSLRGTHKKGGGPRTAPGFPQLRRSVAVNRRHRVPRRAECADEVAANVVNSLLGRPAEGEADGVERARDLRRSVAVELARDRVRPFLR